MKKDILSIIESATIANTNGYAARLVEPAVDSALAAGLLDGDTFRHGPVGVKISGNTAIGTAPDGRVIEIEITDANRDGLIKSKAIHAGLGANGNA